MTKKREEIEDKYKWNLTKIYKDEKSFNNDYKNIQKLISSFSYDAKKLKSDALYLYEVFTNILNIRRKIGNIYTFAYLKYNEDIASNESIVNLDRVETLANDYSKKVSSFNSILLTIDIDKMYQECDSLLEYKREFDLRLRYKNHILSEIEEELIAKLQKAFEDNEKIFSNLTDSDIDFGTILDEHNKEVKLTNTNYSIYAKSLDRRVRKDAFKQLYGTYGKYKTTITSLLDGKIKAISTMNKVRKFNSSIEASLFDDEFTPDVYNSLIESVNDGLETLYKYYELRKELLGLDEMHIYDTYVSLVSEYDKKYSYEDAKKLVKDSLSVLGKNYSKILNEAFEENWIDVYPNIGKKSGAFSGGGYDTVPYILTNFQGEYNDVSTLAHELGHSIHSYFTRKENPYVYGDYSIVVAEVASTVNEILLSKYIIENSKDKEEKQYVLDRLINLFKSTIYRQTMYAEFEKFIYEKRDNDEALTSDLLEEYFLELNKKYYGPCVIMDEEIRYEWERMPHMYYNFYVYKYATGLSAASFIVENILKGDKEYLDKYLKFLSVGSTLSPKDSLMLVDIDITKKQVFQSAIKMLDELITKVSDINE